MRAAVWAVAAALALSLAGDAAASAVPRGIDPKTDLADLVPTRWSTAEGLPTNVLLGVGQLAAGDIWVAGFGGLARFDGIAFEPFHPRARPGLAVGSFYDVVEDGDTLWVATASKGLWKLDAGGFSPLSPRGPSRLSIRSLALDGAGDLWVGTAENGAFRRQGERLVAVDHPSLEDVTVRAIVEDAAGELWFGTEGKGLIRLSADGYSRVGPEDGLVSALARSRRGGLWIGRPDGLSLLLDGALRAFPEVDGVEVFGLTEDDYGSLWIASEQGLFRLRDEASGFEHLPTLDGEPLRSINQIAFDHEGSAWVSSYVNGLFQLREGWFRNYTRADGLRTLRVNSVYAWDEDRLLVGGDVGVIDLVERGAVSPFELRTRLPEVRVRSFLEDSRGVLWISTQGGLLRRGGGEERFLTREDGLPVDHVRLVFEDSAGALWAGTRGGGLLRLLPDGGFATVDRASGLASDFVLALAEDPEGGLLIGTQGGLSVRAADGSITTYTTSDGLPDDLVFNLQVDAGGSVWIATADGLGRLLDGRIDALTSREGLPSDAIYDLREDGHGNLWMSSSQGVIRVSKAEVEDLFAGRRATVEPTLLDRSDGIAEPQCTGATRMARTADGRLWIPTLGGLAVVDPSVPRRNPVPPPIAIRGLAIDGVPIQLSPGADIEVEPGSRKLEFSFAAMSFQAPARVRVRYRLEGFDDDWVEAGRQRRAIYAGLPPGRYLFRLTAANNDGVWSEDEARLGLRVRRRLLQTPLFLVLAAAAAVGVPWGLYRLRVATARRREEELEGMLDEQMRLESEMSELIVELESRNEQLEHFTYAISHDLKSPLYTIQGFLGMAEKDYSAGNHERFREDMARIRQATESMNGLLDGLLRLHRSGEGELQIEEVDLGRVARRAAAALQGRLSDLGLEVEIAADLPLVPADPTLLFEVFQNLLENAAKFMGDQPRPRIEVGWRPGGRSAVFFVRDNGIGIDSRFADRIFRVFERLDPARPGTGLGLAIVKRVVEAHGGRVWVESAGLGRGASFCFTLAGQADRGPHGPAE